jgi:preprotein translocase subunit YajC
MSNSKTAIAEIKKLMKQFGFMSDDSVLKSFKLEDNSILETTDLKAGEKITRINDEFERVALENGTFRLVENFEIEVKDGKITKVKEVFIDATLKDGTKIKVDGDQLLAGGKVVVVTPDAEIPAPDAVHELEDGTKVETKDGIIVSVMEAPEDETEVEVNAGMGEPDPMGEPAAPVAKGMVEPQDEIMSLLKDFIVKCSEKMSDMQNKMEAMNNEFSAFKKEPSAKKIANGKTDFNKTNNSDDIDAKLATIMSLRKNNI